MEKGVYNEPEGSYCDTTVRNVEDRVEEGDVPAAYISVDKREIKHIHHPALEKRSIIPDHSIKDTVDNVSDGSRCDKGKGNEEPHRSLFLEKVAHPPDKDAGEDNAESSEHILPYYSAE